MTPTTRTPALALAAAALFAACDASTTPAPGPVADDAPRQRIGKSDWTPSGTCEDACGSKTLDGNCYCDDLCETYGDCCSDKATVCDGVPECFVGGCSGQLCAAQPGMISTCEWKNEYACYKQPGAVCEAQADGSCGWTMTGDAAQCLAEANDCNPVMCEMYCEYGFVKDVKGCEICSCNEPPADAGCESHDDCDADEYCQPIVCITAPCLNPCVERGVEGDACSEDAMCKAGLVCAGGACAAPATSPCQGHCGGPAPEGCWCDQWCSYYGDCCPGKTETCQ